MSARLWREHAAPWRLGLAVAVGVVVGCSPFFGLHLWIGLGLAVLLRLNKVAVFLGSQISIPPLAPLLGFASVQLGSLILRGRTILLTIDDFGLTRLPALLRDFFLSWLLGGLVLGLALSLPACLLTAAIKRRRDRRRRGLDADGPWRERLLEAAGKYVRAPRPHRFYARFKYTMDPLYRQVSELIPPGAGRVVDLGTGLGMLPVLLSLGERGCEITGVDWDAAKIESGRQAAEGNPAVELIEADVRGYALPAADVVVLADVLHYWPVADQRELLRRSAAALLPGGRLIVRETDREARSWLTRLLERAAVRVGWNRGPGLRYRTAQELRQELEALGLRCDARSASSSVHKGNVLIWGDRAPSSAGG